MAPLLQLLYTHSMRAPPVVPRRIIARDLSRIRLIVMAIAVIVLTETSWAIVVSLIMMALSVQVCLRVYLATT